MSNQYAQLFALLFNQQRWDNLESALQQSKDALESGGEGDLWKFWQAALAAGRGNLEEAKSLIKDLPENQASDARRLIAMESVRKLGDWSDTITLFTERWSLTGAPAELFNLCMAHLSSGNPDFVADHALELVRGMQTAEALRAAVTAATQSKRWSLCLDLLNEYGGLFPKNALPSDLRRARIIAEQGMGMMAEALKHAEELVKEEESAPNLDILFQVQINAGRLRSAILPAEKLMRHPETSANTLVRVAQVMRLEDRALASAALRTAVDRGVSGPQTVAAAYLLAHELGSEELISSLHPQFSEMAQTPNPFLKMGDLSMAVEAFRVSRENAQEAMKQWRRGSVPVHFLRRGVNVPLAWWPIQALAAGGESCLSRLENPVFFRHGARLSTPPPRTIERLYADVTSLINAHELGILPKIESAFGPLCLPPSLRVSLVQQLDDVSGGQPDVEADRAIVLKLIDEGKIEPWNFADISRKEPDNTNPVSEHWLAAIAEVKRRNGILVDFWPSQRVDGEPDKLAFAERSLFASGADIVTALRAFGRITGQVADRAAERLKDASHLTGISVPAQQGEPVLLVGIMAEQFARAGILDTATSTFKVAMPLHDVQWIRNEAQQKERRDRVRAGISGLLNHLQLKSTAVDFALQKELSGNKEDLFGNAAELCIEELLLAPPGDNYWAWIDDRHINAYERCGELPILSTLGIIEELRRLERLSEAEYFDLRHRMRAADFRYIPIVERELIYHISRAQIIGGILAETPELLCLRRYFALALLDPGTLQWPPLDFPTPHPQGEISYVIDIIQHVADAMVSVFGKSVEPYESKCARADWLRRWFWLPPEMIGFLFVPSDVAFENQVKGAGTRALAGIGDIILLAKAINRGAFSPIDNRSQYLNWLESALLPDSARQEAAAQQVRATLEGRVLSIGKSRRERAVNAAVLCDWYLALPLNVRESVDLSDATRNKLGIGTGNALSIGPESFETTEFWESAERALLGEAVKVTPINSKHEYLITAISQPDHIPMLELRSDQRDQPLRIKDDLLLLLNPDKQKRIDVMEEHPEWLDSPARDKKYSVARIAGISSAAERTIKVEEFRHKSAWHFYKMLERSFGLPQGPSLESMAPPQGEVLRHYLRLKPSDSLIQAAQFDAAARRMLRDLGVVETISRLTLLPRDLPDKVLSAFDILTEAEQQATIAELRKSEQHPLARAQAVRLLLRLNKSAEAAAVAREMLSDENGSSTEGLLRVLRWSWNQFGLPPRAETVNGLERLLFSWVHAGQLFRFVRAISEPSSIIQFFSKHDNTPRSEFLAAPQYEGDIAWSEHVSARQLLILALASALESEPEKSGAITQEIKGVAEEWCFERKEDLRWPQLAWLHDPKLYSNGIDSFLAKPREKLLRFVLGEQAALEFSSLRLFRECEALITALEQEPKSDAAWILLGALFRGQQCPPGVAERLRAFLSGVEIVLIELEDMARQSAVLVFATQAWALDGWDLALKAKSQIAKLAGLYAVESVSPIQNKRRQRFIVQAAQGLSRSAPEAVAAKLFAETGLSALDAWPDLIATLADACDVLISLPPKQQPFVAKLLTRIRFEARHIEGGKAEALSEDGSIREPC